MRIGGRVVNRTQQLVLGFVVAAWLSLIVILLVSPEIYDASLEVGGTQRRLVDLGFLVAISIRACTMVQQSNVSLPLPLTSNAQQSRERREGGATMRLVERREEAHRK